MISCFGRYTRTKAIIVFSRLKSREGKREHKIKMSPGTIAGIVAGVVGFVLVIVVVWLIYYYEGKRRNDKREMARLLAGADTLQNELDKQRDEVTRLQEAWRIDPTELRIVGFVAQGGEGRVYRGIWRSQFDVAVKALLRDPEIPEDHGFSNSPVDFALFYNEAQRFHRVGLALIVAHCSAKP